jgi:hypothetical protein
MVLALLSGAHRPTALHDAAACRQALGPHRYGQVTRAPPVLLPLTGSYATQRKPFGRVRRARSTIGESAARAASGLLPSAVDRRISGWLAFRWCRLPLPLGVLFGSESAACGRIDALVAVVPAAPIARRRIPSQHFLNDTRARSAVSRLGLGYYTLADFKSHAHSLVVHASRGSSPSVICHHDQCPIPRPRTCLTVGWQSRF